MASSYPGALDTTAKFPATVEDDTDSTSGVDLGQSSTVGFLAQWLRDAGDATIKIQTELGVTPKGTFADVATRLNARPTVRKTADQTFSAIALANVTDMSFAVASGQDYYFKFICPYTPPAVTTTGVSFGVTCPALTGYITYGVNIYGFAANGAAANFFGVGRASGGIVTSTAVGTASLQNIAVIEGIMSNASASGTLQLQAATEVAASNVIIKKGSYGELYLN